MEGEQSAQHTETDEDEGEESTLDVGRNEMRGLGNLIYVHRIHTTILAIEIVDAEQAQNQECRATHQHQGELHGCIFFLARTPYTNQEVHRNKCHLIEHEHGEHIGTDKEAKHTR